MARTARVDELLELLWADVNLWQRIHDGDDGLNNSSYIQRKHGLRFPSIPLAVWREIATRLKARDRLFRFHRDESIVSGSEIRLHGACDFRTVWTELLPKMPENILGELFWSYLFEPALDHRHLIAQHQLSPDQLKTLRVAAFKFAAELNWCAANPGIVPPPLASNPRHRKSDVDRTRAIEALVKKLIENPDLSNYELAGSKASDPKDAALKIAATARRLVELRECKSVARYSELRAGRTIGRKPRRHSKTANKK